MFHAPCDKSHAPVFRLVLPILCLLLCACAETFSGKCVAVKDGDTIEVMRQGKAVVVRLHGVDCPEKGQDFGTRARQFTGDLAFNKTVTVEKRDTDRYGRIVGVVTLPNGRSLNLELVRAGYAWWYRDYAPKDKTLQDAEKAAREAKVGLWSQKNPIAPWEFRKAERESRLKRTSDRRSDEEKVERSRAGTDVVYATKTGDRYHESNCKRLKKSRIETTRDKAEAQGLKPCSICDP